MITLYVKTICPKCMPVKGQLASNEIPHELVYVDKDEAAAQELLAKGFMQSPIMLKDGEYITDIPTMMQIASGE